MFAQATRDTVDDIANSRDRLTRHLPVGPADGPGGKLRRCGHADPTLH
jgi:hypothetical protein